MKLKLLAAAAVVAVCTASGAMAQETGWYGAVDVGYNQGHDLHGHAEAGSTNQWALSKVDDWAGFARLGYQINPHFRVEAEGGFRRGRVDSFRTKGTTATSVPAAICMPGITTVTYSAQCGSPGGRVEDWSLMGNVIYDFLPDSVVDPFVGVGAGVVKVDARARGILSNVGPVTAANPAVQNLVLDDDDTSFAYQGLAGLAIKATDQLKVDLTYRIFAVDKVKFAATNAAAGGFQPKSFDKMKGYDQTVSVGLRYSFAAPPPPPRPAAASAAASPAPAASPAAASAASAAAGFRG